MLIIQDRWKACFTRQANARFGFSFVLLRAYAHCCRYNLALTQPRVSTSLGQDQGKDTVANNTNMLTRLLQSIEWGFAVAREAGLC